MLKLKEGFEYREDAGVRYVAPSGGGFRSRVASWCGKTAFFIVRESLIAYRDFDRNATPEDAHRLILEHGPAYGVESPWDSANTAPRATVPFEVMLSAKAVKEAGDRYTHTLKIALPNGNGGFRTLCCADVLADWVIANCDGLPDVTLSQGPW